MADKEEMTFVAAGGYGKYLTARVYDMRYPTLLLYKKRLKRRSLKDTYNFSFMVKGHRVYKIVLHSSNRWWQKGIQVYDFCIHQNLLYKKL